MTACSHLDQVAFVDPPAEIAGCDDCLRSGGRWLHLRMCQTCGQVGCCDSSPSRHASRHAREAGHPIARSVEPGEDWSWCYVDELMFALRPG
ncbi:MAG TPA: UBP-type zinc finger domain-containing protein [Solirubrobacteraceae bacterium]|nr:UBP-type zinc finger domain-containing protein [Solirubrobacteraceae bacterium]